MCATDFNMLFVSLNAAGMRKMLLVNLNVTGMRKMQTYPLADAAGSLCVSRAQVVSLQLFLGFSALSSPRPLRGNFALTHRSGRSESRPSPSNGIIYLYVCREVDSDTIHG